MAAAFAFGGYLVVLYPGLKTPADRPGGVGGTGNLAELLKGLPGDVQQQVANAFELYQRSPVPDVSRFEQGGFTSGAKDAPVKLLEFFDIRCVHCKHFAEVLHQIERSVPEGTLQVDLRLFPLDATCNSAVSKDMTDETNVRCLGARALICLEDRGGFREAQDRLFKEQGALTLERALAIAAEEGKISRGDLDACIRSKETEAKLQADIGVAMAYDIEGTPLVIVNGRRAIAIAPFLYGLILSKGDVRAPGWQVLPRPQADASR